MTRKAIKIAIPKLKQHADKVLADLDYNCTAEEFKEEYKKQFLEEYEKYEHGYNEVIKMKNHGKGTPPALEVYLKNAYNNAMMRRKKEQADS